MANTLIDCIKLYSVIAGPDFDGESNLTYFQPKVTIPSNISDKTNLNGLKIGVDYEWCGEDIHETISSSFLKKLDFLTSKGAELIKVMSQKFVSPC